MNDSILAWHFAGTRMRDGSELGMPGTTEKYHNGKPSLCESGLHASVNILDALAYAPGPLLRRVRLSGHIIHGEDKLCASRREVLWEVDMSNALRVFARKCALDVVHLWSALDIVFHFLVTGEDAARDAARDAASDAVWAAAMDAARNTARDAARDAAWDAARGAGAAARGAGAAARDAAMDAAWAAAMDAARNAAWDAARDAARDAAWAAARAKQNKRLENYAYAARAGLFTKYEINDFA